MICPKLVLRSVEVGRRKLHQQGCTDQQHSNQDSWECSARSQSRISQIAGQTAGSRRQPDTQAYHDRADARRDHEDLPGNSPPWGTLNSIDLATGEIDWQITFGNYPSHPDLGYGAESYGGPVVTASGLIFIAATPDRKFRVYDTQDASLLWEHELPAAGFSTPAMYSIDGQQFVVIAAGGGRMGPPSGSEYLAFSLPQ